MEEIKLTLDSMPEAGEEAAAIKRQEERDAMAVKFDDSTLTPEEKAMVEEFSTKIDLHNTNQLMTYGSAAQQKVAGFSETALKNVRTKDLGEIGNSITDLVTELKGFEVEEEQKGFLGIFKKAGNKITVLKTKYDKAEVSVNQCTN